MKIFLFVAFFPFGFQSIQLKWYTNSGQKQQQLENKRSAETTAAHLLMGSIWSCRYFFLWFIAFKSTPSPSARNRRGEYSDGFRPKMRTLMGRGKMWWIRADFIDWNPLQWLGFFILNIKLSRYTVNFFFCQYNIANPCGFIYLNYYEHINTFNASTNQSVVNLLTSLH